jgi:hypothetical protein
MDGISRSMTVVARDVDDYQRFVFDKLSKLPNMATYRSTLIMRTVKHNYGPASLILRGIGKSRSKSDLAMRLKLTQWLASALAIGGTAFLATLAEGQTDSVRERALGPVQVIQQPEESKELTGKERLGNKWMDEQRVDNCKVPIDKRGTKPRPDTCSHAPAE